MTKAKLNDPAEELYSKRRDKLDLNRSIETNSMWSFGLVALGFFFILYIVAIPLLIITGPIAVILGLSGWRIVKKNKKVKGTSIALMGIIFGSLQFILGVVSLARGWFFF